MASSSARGAGIFVLVLIAGLASAQTNARAGVAHHWVNETQSAASTQGITANLAAKYYAMVGIAMHEALSAGGAPPPALAAFAAHTILAGSFPWLQGKYDMIISKQLSSISPADKKEAAEIAVPIAARILKERTADASTRWAMFQPAAPGTLWAYQFAPGQMTSLTPQQAQAVPMKLTPKESEDIAFNKDASKGPVFKPAKTDYKDTFLLGSKNSTQRSQYDTDSALFWALGSNTSGLSGAWLTIARKVLPADISLEDAALFYARAGAAVYDTVVTTWKVKHSVLGWRPITAFRSGYPGFAAVSDWESLIPTPPHPEYPSGHMAVSGAMTEVLLRTLKGRDEVSFTLTPESTPWLTRTYKSLSSTAKEIGDSRVYGGVHFRFSNEDGLKLGKLVGAKVFQAIQPAKSSGQGGTTTERGPGASAGRRLMK